MSLYDNGNGQNVLPLVCGGCRSETIAIESSVFSILNRVITLSSSRMIEECSHFEPGNGLTINQPFAEQSFSDQLCAYA